MKSVKSILMIATIICSIMIANSVVAETDGLNDVSKKVITSNTEGETEITEESITSEVPSADISDISYNREIGGTKVDISFEVNSEGEIKSLDEEADFEDMFNSSEPIPIGYIILVKTENSSYMILYEADICTLSDGTELDFEVDDSQNVFSTSFDLDHSSEVISEVGVMSSFISMEGFTSFVTYSDTAPDSFNYMIAEISAPTSDIETGDEVEFIGLASNLAELLSFSMAEAEYTYEWDFDDDGVNDKTGDTVTHTFQYPGSYPIKLTVSDSEGTETMTTTTVTVSEGTNSNGDTSDNGSNANTDDGAENEESPIMIFIAIIAIIVIIGVIALVVVIRR